MLRKDLVFLQDFAFLQFDIFRYGVKYSFNSNEVGKIKLLQILI